MKEKSSMGLVDEKVNILIVDDRPENLLTLEAVLTRSDYNLIKAESGEEALRQLLSIEAAVIILDVRMPGMDGFETATLIKSRDKYHYIPIIFISASNMDENSIRRGYDTGGVDYLTKPFDPKALQKKVAFYVDLYKKHLFTQKQAELEKLLRKQEQLHALDQLRRNEEYLQLIMETNHIGIWEWDVEAGTYYWSDQFQKLWGYKPGEFSPTMESFWQRIHPEDRDRVDLAIREAAREKSDYEIEYRIVLPNGDLHWIFSKGRALQSSSKQLSRISNVIIDITRQKLAEQESRRATGTYN